MGRDPGAADHSGAGAVEAGRSVEDPDPAVPYGRKIRPARESGGQLEFALGAVG